MDNQNNFQKNDQIPFDGSHITMEEATLASFGLDPDKAGKLDTNIEDLRRTRTDAF
jgi:hypothetical protein